MGSIYKRPNSRFLWIKYYQNGRVVRESTETTKEVKARRMLKRREGDIENGIPINPRMDKITFEDASKDLLNDYSTNKKRSHDDTKRRVDLHLEPFFRGRRLVSITTATIRAYIAHRQAQLIEVKPARRIKTANGVIEVPAVTRPPSNATINRELSALSRMFSLARQAALIHTKPHIPKLAEAPPRQGFFDAAQFQSVKDRLPPALQPVAEFAHITGWRVCSEILKLEWRQVDWQGRVVRLEPGTTKNRDGRTFPFTQALEQLLEAQLVEHDRLKQENRIIARVFHRDGEPIKSLRGAWRSACAAAGVPGRILHDFRRTAVRNLERVGVPRATAMKMIGHKTESIYRRYAIVDEGSLREAAAKLDQIAVGTLSGTAATVTPNARAPRTA